MSKETKEASWSFIIMGVAIACIFWICANKIIQNTDRITTAQSVNGVLLGRIMDVESRIVEVEKQKQLITRYATCDTIYCTRCEQKIMQHRDYEQNE